MIDLYPESSENQTRLLALAGRGYSGLAMVCGMRRGRPGWTYQEGCNLLVRWEGERLPYATLDVVANRREAQIVGFAPHDAEQIDTFAGVNFANDTIYHFATIQMGQTGVPTEIDPFDVQARVIDGGGQLVGLLPNAPSDLHVRLLPGTKPLVSWVFSRFCEQADADHFDVYEASGEDGSFDFGADPAGQVDHVNDVTSYEWTGAALSPGDVRHYTVRAVSADGVLSLIPQLGRGPAAKYDEVALARCPKLIVPTGPPATITPTLEMVR